MKIKIAPHPIDHDECDWVMWVKVPCLPPIGAHFTINRDGDKPMVGAVSMHLFDGFSGEVVVKVAVSSHTDDEIEKICSSSSGWERW